MRILGYIGRLAQLLVLACVGYLLFRTLFMSVQLINGIYFPTTKLPFFDIHPALNVSFVPGILEWQEPFKYKIKVYLTNHVDHIRGDSGNFRDYTKVWQIKSQTLDNRYPVFRERIRLNLTSSATDSYLSVFMQEAAQFSPYPNLGDPFLFTNTIQVTKLHHQAVTPTNGAKNTGQNSNESRGRTLSVRTQAAWNLHMEDSLSLISNAYSPMYYQHPVTLDSIFWMGYALDPPSDRPSYSPLLHQDQTAPPKVRLFSVPKENDTVEVDVDLEIRGLDSGQVHDTRHVAAKLNLWIKQIRGRCHMSRVPISSSPTVSPTYKDIVSSAIYIALFPTLVALWILCELSIAKLLIELVLTNGSRTRFVIGAYTMGLVSHDNLKDNIGLAIPHKRMQVVFSWICFFWRFSPTCLAFMPFDKILRTIRGAIAMETTDNSEVEKDNQTRECATNTEDDDVEKAYITSVGMTVKMAFASLVLRFAAEAVHSFYISGDLAALGLVDAWWILVAHRGAVLYHAVSHLYHFMHAAAFFPSIFVSFSRRSTQGVPIAFHALHAAGFIITGLLCLYQTPFVMKQEITQWSNIVNGISSIALLVQWTVYDRL